MGGIADTRDIGRRCGMGCETWPDDEAYADCPQCGEPTRRCRGVRPLSPDEAQSRKAHLDFESIYEVHESERGELSPLTQEECDRLGLPC